MSDDASPAETDEKPRKRLGCLFYSMAALLVILFIPMIVYQRWYANARDDLAAEMRRIVDRGEPLWFADLAPEPPDPNENGTGIFLSAVAKLVPQSQAFYELVAGEKPTPPGKNDFFEIALDQNRPALELMRQAVRRPFFRLPLDYRTTQPISIQLEPIQQAREFSHLLKAETLQAIGEGDNDRAVAAIVDGLLLSEMLRDEPLLITQLVRIAIAGVAIESLATLLAHVDLTPEQFAAIDEQLALMESRFRLAHAILGERAMALTTMHNLGDNLDLGDLASGRGGGGADPGMRVLNSAPAKPYRMNDEAFMLRIMSRYLDHIDQPGPEGKQGLQQIESEIFAAKVSFRHILTCLLAPAVLQCREAGLRHRQRLANARLALRVARYRAKHGKFPGTLNAVADEKLSTVPPDVWSGKPLVFRVLADGFTIYPVGENGVDDGGGESPDRQEHSATFRVQRPSAE